MRKNLPFLLGFLLILLIAAYLLSNTQVKLEGSPDDGRVQLETSFPNADCSKTLTTDFPFVRFGCEERDAP